MTDLPTVELFVLKCAVLKTELDKASGKVPLGSQSAITPLLAQVAHHVRINAEKMAEYYKIFYLLENDIRELIDDTMSEAHGPDWWNSKAPASAKDECKLNQKREREAGVTSRSVRSWTIFRSGSWAISSEQIMQTSEASSATRVPWGG